MWTGGSVGSLEEPTAGRVLRPGPDGHRGAAVRIRTRTKPPAFSLMSPAPRTGSEMEEEVKLEGRYKTIKSSGPGPKDLQNSEVSGSSRYQSEVNLG